LKKGTLYLVPNTLGEDNRALQVPQVITPYVMQIAAQLDYWIVENAKTARAFLSAVNQIAPLKTPLQEISMTQWRGPQSEIKPRDILEPLLNGFDMGLISEAGLPAIADPGTELVALAHQLKIPIKPLTGPSSLMIALMASGMNGQQFSFHGYLPIKNPDRLKKLKSLENDSRTSHAAQLWIETPYRNTSMLTSATEALNAQTQVCIAMDLTLATETIMRMSVQQWRDLVLQNPTALPQNMDKRPTVFILQAN
jgi:16S rRNA (cytidine1402-2'-O)-methyltransferase